VTEADIWKWQCAMFLYASFLYYEEDLSVWSDESYDAHCHFLLLKYDKLPAEFRERVSKDDLSAGTGYAVKLTDAEKALAREWYARLHPGNL
jgi:hypothetical protein